MSDGSLAMRTKVKIFIGGVDISKDVNASLVSFTYTDNEADEADDLQITLADTDGYWLCDFFGKAVNEAASGSISYSGGSGGNLYRVTANSGLNVRTGPGTNYSRLGAMPYGTEIAVSSISNNWATINYSGQTAYACASYLTPTGAQNAQGTTSQITGFGMQAVIVKENCNCNGGDRMLDCGLFELDAIDYSSSNEMKIKGTSLPYSSPVRQTLKSKAWEGYTLKGIALEIAQNAGMALMFECGSNPSYERREQVQQSDIAFLRMLCIAEGISLKATANILVLFDQARYEQQGALVQFDRNDGSYTKLKLSTGERDQAYGACHVSYTDPMTGYSVQGRFEAEDPKEDAQTLEIRQKVSNVQEANALARKMLRLKNKFAMTADLTVPGNTALVAGVCVNLGDFGAFSGKYIITQAKHDIGRRGYKTSLKLRKVLEGY